MARITRAEPATHLSAQPTALSNTFRSAWLTPWAAPFSLEFGAHHRSSARSCPRKPSWPRDAQHQAGWRKSCSPGSRHRSVPYVQSGHLYGRRHEAVRQKITNVGNETAAGNCHECGTADRHYRKSRAEFHCVACSHADNADLNAAANFQASGIGAYPRRGAFASATPATRELNAKAAWWLARHMIPEGKTRRTKSRRRC